MTHVPRIPRIDLRPISEGGGRASEAALQIDRACRDLGFFYVLGHDVDPRLGNRLDTLAREFFALPETEKASIRMALAGRAWRGWFPLRGELTSGIPDQKEGIYFGAELGPDHPRVRARTPMHGPNLFPDRPAELRQAVLEYIEQMTELGQTVLSGIALALGLPSSWFAQNLTTDPLVLFRIFRYPALEISDRPTEWSVGEHTDYGLLTLLAQDDTGGLQVRTHSGWIDVPPVEGSFVCNLGDMLERLTGGIYGSTPHRVRNPGSSDRLSFPFFIDPSWDAIIERLPLGTRSGNETQNGAEARQDCSDRWDHENLHEFGGTYGEYILNKVGRVFPDLARTT
jgi:isopenicillin N synthase-like dioxygenase